MAYFQLRRFGDSARTFERAVKLNGQNYLTWGNLGDAYYWTPGERDKAASAYEKAVALAQAALRVNPHDAAVMTNLADYYSMQGRREDALRFLGRALALNPNEPELMFKAAEVYQQRRRPKPVDRLVTEGTGFRLFADHRTRHAGAG